MGGFLIFKHGAAVCSNILLYRIVNFLSSLFFCSYKEKIRWESSRLQIRAMFNKFFTPLFNHDATYYGRSFFFLRVIIVF